MSEKIKIRELSFGPLFSAEQIQTRVRELGAALTQQHGKNNPLFVSILSGAFVFAADLIRAFDGTCEVGFVKLASYSGTRSTGDVQTIMGLEKDLR
ncbi:MAG: hypoxanthine phosphoribosyltransferase, partial [Saprospiraceae bacterium]|nr:hypoxanthine phosphoribosyltransferase [Saprospiraceae bacterium]